MSPAFVSFTSCQHLASSRAAAASRSSSAIYDNMRSSKGEMMNTSHLETEMVVELEIVSG
jgi:hypothetical protein